MNVGTITGTQRAGEALHGTATVVAPTAPLWSLNVGHWRALARKASAYYRTTRSMPNTLGVCVRYEVVSLSL